jgi:undecaprenyl diphosphate synthase
MNSYNHIITFSISAMQHIGFIMDGNRRWAKKLGNIASFGHKNGFKNIENVLDMCLSAKIPYVSMWGLSKENITERSSEEIAALFEIIRTQVTVLAEKLKKE